MTSGVGDRGVFSCLVYFHYGDPHNLILCLLYCFNIEEVISPQAMLPSVEIYA